MSNANGASSDEGAPSRVVDTLTNARMDILANARDLADNGDREGYEEAMEMIRRINTIIDTPWGAYLSHFA